MNNFHKEMTTVVINRYYCYVTYRGSISKLSNCQYLNISVLKMSWQKSVKKLKLTNIWQWRQLSLLADTFDLRFFLQFFNKWTNVRLQHTGNKDISSNNVYYLLDFNFQCNSIVNSQHCHLHLQVLVVNSAYSTHFE